MTDADAVRPNRPSELSLQERYAPQSICYGCGPANPGGLHLRSFRRGPTTVAIWQPQLVHQAFPGMLNGGVISTLLDCHANWTAATHALDPGNPAEAPPAHALDPGNPAEAPPAHALDPGNPAEAPPAEAPVTVTAEIEVRLTRPTPIDRPVRLVAEVEGVEGDRIRVVARLISDGVASARLRGTFVIVGPDHAAYRAWSSSGDAPTHHPARRDPVTPSPGSPPGSRAAPR